jgi:hypothetical protein
MSIVLEALENPDTNKQSPRQAWAKSILVSINFLDFKDKNKAMLYIL